MNQAKKRPVRQDRAPQSVTRSATPLQTATLPLRPHSTCKRGPLGGRGGSRGYGPLPVILGSRFSRPLDCPPGSRPLGLCSSWSPADPSPASVFSGFCSRKPSGQAAS
ncbi:Hypothetical predicted protein [Marmota monax]|uniref:Uncharacterized protein n=1 Tax=Marmota monax TaxID=9995 RepID=A0A5E4BIZ0_MARMO|nr:Hypothetical predicted protein [Marmota monax]